jgi:GNAT superfamily N-acetyltransferase
MRAQEFILETRNKMFAFVKQQFPTWPDYVLKDFLYQQAKGIRSQEELADFLKRNRNDFDKVHWRLEKLPITMDIFTPKTQRMLVSREGGSANPYQVPRDAERHAQQLKMIQQKGVSEEPIIVAKLNNGYDLIEGWHRTIQHLQVYPKGYTAPAWVGYGATYTSESIKQGVAEGLFDRFKKKLTANIGGIDLTASKEGGRIIIDASSQGKQLGIVMFNINGKTLVADRLMVQPEYRGQGIAEIMYDWAKGLGYTVQRSSDQTDDGKRFWDKLKGEETNVWEQDVAEST